MGRIAPFSLRVFHLYHPERSMPQIEAEPDGCYWCHGSPKTALSTLETYLGRVREPGCAPKPQAARQKMRKCLGKQAA